MSKYVVKRILLMIPTIIGAGILVFLMMRLLPGDICLIRIAGDGMGVSEQALERCRAEFGLDKPLWAQFVDFVVGYATLDLASRCGPATRSRTRSGFDSNSPSRSRSWEPLPRS